MEFVNVFLDVVKNKYALFEGRARRKEYWSFALVYFVAYIVLSVLDNIVTIPLIGFPVFSGLFSLALLVPNIALTIRRLHDTNRSGWWILIAIIPFIGPIALLVLMVLEGQPSENQYGEDPKALPAAA